eukprot:3287741-Rhodomonas_salina.4
MFVDNACLQPLLRARSQRPKESQSFNEGSTMSKALSSSRVLFSSCPIAYDHFLRCPGLTYRMLLPGASMLISGSADGYSCCAMCDVGRVRCVIHCCAMCDVQCWHGVVSRIVLRVCIAMSSTSRATRSLCHVRSCRSQVISASVIPVSSASSLRVRYAMSGTETGMWYQEEGAMLTCIALVLEPLWSYAFTPQYLVLM